MGGGTHCNMTNVTLPNIYLHICPLLKCFDSRALTAYIIMELCSDHVLLR